MVCLIAPEECESPDSIQAQTLSLRFGLFWPKKFFPAIQRIEKTDLENETWVIPNGYP